MSRFKWVEPIVNLEYQLLRAQAVLDWFVTACPLDANTSRRIDEEAMKRLQESLKSDDENFEHYRKVA